MTVVAFKDGVMAADTCSYASHLRYRAMEPKILRCDLGLIGVAGRSSDAAFVRAWFAAGMGREDRPPDLDDKDDPVGILWAKPDGTLWWGDHRLLFHEISTPATCGESSACIFAEGAMAAGLSADAAVRLAIKHCLYAAGDVQVENL